MGGLLCGLLGGGGGGTQVVDAEKATVPYLVGVDPYRPNPPVPIVTDNISTDGTVSHDDKGSYTHPSVIDFHGLTPDGLFAGYRYWMANSEYSDYGVENTMVLCSDDGFDWRQPPGATPGPIHPVAQNGYYTDPELAYDATAGALVVMWRQDTTPCILWHTSTTDGINWTAKVEAFSGDRTAVVSFALVPDGGGGWLMFAFGNAGYRSSAPALTGPWATPTRIATLTGWHGGVWRDPATGKFYALASDNGESISALVSTDGTTWTNKGKVILRQLGWEVRAMYRPTLQPHPDGERFRVWYSVNGMPGPDNRTGYTAVLRSLWD